MGIRFHLPTYSIPTSRGQAGLGVCRRGNDVGGCDWWPAVAMTAAGGRQRRRTKRPRGREKEVNRADRAVWRMLWLLVE